MTDIDREKLKHITVLDIALLQLQIKEAYKQRGNESPWINCSLKNGNLLLWHSSKIGTGNDRGYNLSHFDDFSIMRDKIIEDLANLPTEEEREYRELNVAIAELRSKVDGMSIRAEVLPIIDEFGQGMLKLLEDHRTNKESVQ